MTTMRRRNESHLSYKIISSLTILNVSLDSLHAFCLRSAYCYASLTHGRSSLYNFKTWIDLWLARLLISCLWSIISWLCVWSTYLRMEIDHKQWKASIIFQWTTFTSLTKKMQVMIHFHLTHPWCSNMPISCQLFFQLL